MSHKVLSEAYTKPHYNLLDGLRGVAALIVIFFHLFEPFSQGPAYQTVNHGFLAVDFFFILSGFVVGYAYDERWGKMTTGAFFKRRLIRLHPMVLFATVWGVLFFVFQGSAQWDGTKVGAAGILLAVLLHLVMIPVLPGGFAEVRGGGEMFPLNGPAWTLFFEYIGNILYACFLRKMSDRVLALWVVLCGLGLAWWGVGNLCETGNFGFGWTMAGHNFMGGFLRMSFSFSLGLLLSRKFKPIAVRGAFWLCSLVLVVLLSVPYIGPKDAHMMNVVYELLCIMVVFPLIVWIAASGKTTDTRSGKICRFLGEVSYPLYIIHYPSIYILFYLVRGHSLTLEEIWPLGIVVLVGNILLAWLLLKYYDTPVRKYLSSRL